MPPKYKFPGAPPKEAIEYFESKGLKVGFDYTDVWKEEHAFAFTAAKIAELDVLSKVQSSLLDALAEGKTFHTWQKEIGPTLDKSGWSNYHKQTPKKSRLRTIYDTNMRMSRSTGQWQRIERTKVVLPFLIYELGPSVRHRPEHEDWEGTTLPVEDPWWDDHFVPNGWG